MQERENTLRAAYQAVNKGASPKPRARGNAIKCRRQAAAQGLEPGSPEYLEFMEKCMRGE